MKYYFIGIAGFGMSALAQIARFDGHNVIGSDRNFDLGKAAELKKQFEMKGIVIVPQNGEHLDKSLDAVIVSTAVEDNNIEILRAKELGLPIIHRSDFLSQYVNKHKTIAISGTSGKSTVTALVYHILNRNLFYPSIITGGAMIELIDKGEIGNAYGGTGDLLVIEADESDGSLIKYRPYCGTILNISKDHKEIAQLLEIFKVFAENCNMLFLNSDDSYLRDLNKKAFYFGLNDSEFKISEIKLSFDSASFKINGQNFILPLPGLHNVYNFLSAAKICHKAFGISLENIANSVRDFKGVYRRFNILGEKNGIYVIDDFAHNPVKIEAALKAAKIDLKGKLIAIYQPHGFAPTRLLKKELIESFYKNLSEKDILIMPEIYYVGGTVSKDISSLDIVKALNEKGKNALYFEKRDKIFGEIKKLALPGDRIIVMGARDLTLRDFALNIYNSL
jgi:UDP-N-acetylmuramate--alanine ligase